MAKKILMLTLCFMVSAFIAVHAQNAKDNPVIWSNFNNQGVVSSPVNATNFSLTKDSVITSVTTYHLFNNASAPGTIFIIDSAGKTYGPWKASGRIGFNNTPNALWDVFPQITLKAGNYQVMTSNSSTWSHNSASGGAGFAEIKGYAVSAAQKPAYPLYTVKKWNRYQGGTLGAGNIKLTLPAYSLPSNSTIKLRALPEAEIERLTTDNFDMLAAPVSVSLNNKSGVLLKKPAMVSVMVPPSEIPENGKIYGAYYTGSKWVYVKPVGVNYEKGIISFKTQNMSTLAAGILGGEVSSKPAPIPTPAPTVAKPVQAVAINKTGLDLWARKTVVENLERVASPYFVQTLGSLGINDERWRSRIVRLVVSNDEYIKMASDFDNGTSAASSQKVKNIVSSAILASIALEPVYAEAAYKLGGNIGLAASKLYENDFNGAMQVVYPTVESTLPVGGLLSSSVEVVNAALNVWFVDGMEEAYHSYRLGGEGRWGYQNAAGDFGGVKKYMGKTLNDYLADSIKAYALSRGLSESSISGSLREDVKERASERLERYFQRRVKGENDISNMNGEASRLIEAFKAQGLLSGVRYYDNGTVIYDARINRLFAAKIAVDNILDGRNLTTSQSAELVGRWLGYGSGNWMPFLRDLQNAGYIRSMVRPVGLPSPVVTPVPATPAPPVPPPSKGPIRDVIDQILDNVLQPK